MTRMIGVRLDNGLIRLFKINTQDLDIEDIRGLTYLEVGPRAKAVLVSVKPMKETE